MENGGGRRAGIAAAVWGVIAAKGIAGVSMRSVAAQAGVSAGLVQHYFKTRDRLVHASMELMIEQAEARYGTAGASPRQALGHALGHVIPASPRSRTGVVVWYAYVAACATDPRAARILARAKRGQEAEVTRLLRLLSPRDDAPPAARRLIALADGLACRVLIGDLDADVALREIDHAIEAECGR